MVKTKNYDFSLKEDQEEILRYYGGKDSMKKNCPIMYEAFCNAVNHPVSNESNIGYISKAQAHYLVYQEGSKTFLGAGNTVLNEKAEILQCIIEIFKNGDRIAADTKIYDNSQYCYMSLETLAEEYHTGEDVKIKVTAIWREKNGILKANSSFESLAIGDYEYIEAYEAVHPKKQISLYSDKIRVSYARIPQTPTYDYIYPESRTAEGYEKVSLNMEGKVKLKSGWKYDSLDEIEASMWSIERGVIEYAGDDPVITVDNDGFTYKFPVEYDSSKNEYCEWNDFIPDSIQYGNQGFDFSLKIKFYINNGQQKELQTIETTSLSIKNPPVNYYTIPQIYLYWGCVAKDTKILLQNGTWISAENIKIGMSVMTDQHNAAIVSNIMKGYEKELLHIETETGKILNLTMDHPVKTDQGYIPARELNGQSVLVTTDNTQEHIKYAYTIAYNDSVYSFTLQNDTLGLAANGLYIGTFETENSVTRKNSSKETDSAILEEIKNIEKVFHNGNR